MTNGDTVFLAFATPRSHDRTPFASVTKATVLDGENGVLRLASGQVLVHEHRWSTSTIHETEADGWRACAARLAAAADGIKDEANRCEAKAAEAAAASRIVAVTA